MAGCSHTSRTVVTGGKLNIYQCDMCGAMLWWLDVPDDVIAAPIDMEALRMWERRATDGIGRDAQRLEQLKVTDREAYRAEVQRLLNRKTQRA